MTYTYRKLLPTDKRLPGWEQLPSSDDRWFIVGPDGKPVDWPLLVTEATAKECTRQFNLGLQDDIDADRKYYNKKPKADTVNKWLANQFPERDYLYLGNLEEDDKEDFSGF